MKHTERGVILLEMLIALAILGSSAVALVSLAAASVRAQISDEAEERMLVQADRVLTASTLLTREELGQRIGRHVVGEFLVGISRPEPGLYRIAIELGESPGVEQLVTVVYRADRIR